VTAPPATPPTAPLTFDEAALRALVRASTGAPPRSISPMPGGASSRQFYRVELPEGTTPPSLVAMFVPDAAPEEVTSGAPPTRWPFLEVQELLASRGVRVPHVVGAQTSKGLLLVEDLGEETLARALELRPAQKTELYVEAVRDLARAQRALEQLPPGSVVGTRAFDESLLRWELEHFREWGLEARGITQPADERAAMERVFDGLARRVAELPRGFVHRDYQSRNLMVVPRGGSSSIVWIDFQDALLGPRVYDLVALLNDSYQTFDRAFVEARLDDYVAARGVAHEREAVGLELDLVTVQRKLKDAGRFVFLDRVKKNPSFLGFVEPTLEKVRGALDRLAERPGEGDLRELRALLGRALGW
jgi:aminoglycoside/choline kinase family phosphotransferase